jgi:hypothetical protein
MKSAFIIKDKTGKPYGVVVLLAGGTEFYPIAESATTWASWMKDEYAARTITKQQLSATLDNSMDVEGPVVANRSNKVKIDELIAKAKKTQEVEPIESEKEEKSAQLVPVISLMDARLDYLENSEWRNAVEFKAKSFIADVNKSTFSYEVKRTRAVFDDSLAIPGTNRRGGWRCPPGTRYGGQITDRFGRNCGWGVSRRLANEIADLGERLEDAGDKRRVGRVARRNERVARRLAQGGRLERAARRVGDVLDATNRPGDGNGDSPKPRGTGLLERAARRVGDALDTDSRGGRRRRGNRGGAVGAFIEGFREGWNGEGTLPGTKPNARTPKIPMGGVREPRVFDQGMARPEDLIPEGSLLPNGGQGVTPKRPKAPKAPQTRPARPRKPRNPQGLDGGGQGVRPRPGDIVPERQPRAPRRQPDVDNVSKTPVPAGAPRASETLEQYKTRKYNEHQQRVREINDAGGNAGFLRREEWEKFHGPAVEENWNRAQQRNAGRGARRTATDAGAARTATRRPKPADVPDANQPARRQRKPFNAPGQRGVSDLAAARRKREFIERDNPAQRGDYKIVKHNSKYYVVSKAEVDRANANGANLDVHNEPPRPGPRRSQVPPMLTDTPSPVNVTPPSPPEQAKTRRGAKIGKAARGFLRPKSGDRKLGPIGKDGLPGWGGVPVGNKGLNTEADAILHVANGGDIADVPDDFVLKAMHDNSGAGKRFKREPAGGGVNGRIPDNMFLFEDRTNGKKYYTKYETGRVSKGEDIREIIGNNMAARLGFPVGEFRFAGPIKSDAHGALRPILFEHAGNYIDGDIKKPANAGRVKDDDKVRATILDYLIVNVDRHGGNYFVAEQNGENRFVPIDPSLGFNAEGYADWNGAMADRAGLAGWLNSGRGGGRNEMLSELRNAVQRNQLTRDEISRVVQEMQDNMRRSQRDLKFDDFARGAQGHVVGNNEQRKLIEEPQQRIDFFLSLSASSIADIIIGS